MYEIRTYFCQGDSLFYKVDSKEIYSSEEDVALNTFNNYIDDLKDELNKDIYLNMIDTEIHILLMNVNNRFPLLVSHKIFEKYETRKISNICTGFTLHQ